MTENSDSKYFEKLGEVFSENIKRLFINQMSVKSVNPFSEDFLNSSQIGYLNEISQHLNYKNLLAKKFFGRAKLVEQVNLFLSSDSKFPLIIHGNSGSGKSCLTAYIATKLGFVEPKNMENSTVIFRFLGSTRQSLTIKDTLISIINQIREIFNEKLSLEDNPFKVLLNDLDNELIENLNINELSSTLSNILNEIYIYCPEEKFYFFIESIDHLQENDLNNLSWFFSSLTPNTKFVYSGELRTTSLLEKFQNKFRNPECYIELRPESKMKSFDLLKTLLTNQNRAISIEQTQIVKSLFDKVENFLPLHIRLITDIVSKWKSNEKPSEEFKLCSINIESCIRYLFKRYEIIFGEKLVSRVLFYFNEFKNGISVQELCDICTLDDDLLQSIFAKHLPLIIQFPIQIVKRFEFEIKDYLYYKIKDETNVVCWFHQSFSKVRISF